MGSPSTTAMQAASARVYREYIYLYRMVISSLSPLALCSLSLLSLAWRGADADPVVVAAVVVVAVAVVVDVTSGHGRAGIGTAPGRTTTNTPNGVTKLQEITNVGITEKIFFSRNRSFEVQPAGDPLFPSAC